MKPKTKPDFTATQLVKPLDGDAGFHRSIVRVNTLRIDALKSDRSRFFRRDPVILKCRATGLKTLGFVMGHSSVCKDAIAIDYDTRAILGLRGNDTANIDVRRARLGEVFGYYIKHPDPGYRLSIQLGVGGAVLGVIGVVLGLISVVGMMV